MGREPVRVQCSVCPAASNFRDSPAAVDSGELQWVKRNIRKDSPTRAESSKVSQVVIRRDLSAPVTGITLCNDVGRHSGTHFDIGFAVNSVPRSKRAMEQKGGKVRRTVLFNKGLRTSTAHDTAVAKRTARGSSAGKGFGEESCKDHEPKKWRSGVTAFSKILAGAQWSVLHCISTDWHPLRWTGGASGVPSPCVLKTLGNRV